MDAGRRGFLIGAVKLIGAGLTLAAVPSAMAKAVEPLIWTPDRAIIPGREVQQGATLMPFGPTYITVHQGNTDTKAIMRWGIAPHGNLLWEACPGNELILGSGQQIQRITVLVDVIAAPHSP